MGGRQLLDARCAGRAGVEEAEELAQVPGVGLDGPRRGVTLRDQVGQEVGDQLGERRCWVGLHGLYTAQMSRSHGDTIAEGTAVWQCAVWPGRFHEGYRGYGLRP